MVSGSTFQGIVFASLCLATAARHGVVHQAHLAAHQHRHEAIELGKREVQTTKTTKSHSWTNTRSQNVLAYITPSPGASPVAVTKQSQIVASYVPEFTLCVLPPVAFYPITASATATQPIGTGPYHNYSISIPSGTGSCSTVFSPTITMVCATTLTALAKKYTVTNCAQDLTFSSEYGFYLVTPTPTPVPLPSAQGQPVSGALVHPNNTMSLGTGVDSRLAKRQASSSTDPAITPGPTIETLTTYYLAPWQQLTAGEAPSDVDLKVCRTFAQNDSTECIREYQVWSTSLVTDIATSTTTVNISTTIHGRSKLIIETFAANITEVLTTFSMSTTMELEYQREWTTTERASRYASTSTGPTVYTTRTLEYAPSRTAASLAPSTSGSNDTTSYTTIQSTSTVYAGTTTVTLPPSGSSPPTASASTTQANFASMLGIGARWLREQLI